MVAYMDKCVGRLVDALQASGVVGSNETLGDELVHSAVYNKLSYSIGQYYYKTDGIRENNDQRQQSADRESGLRALVSYRRVTLELVVLGPGPRRWYDDGGRRASGGQGQLRGTPSRSPHRRPR